MNGELTRLLVVLMVPPCIILVLLVFSEVWPLYLEEWKRSGLEPLSFSRARFHYYNQSYLIAVAVRYLLGG
jgi:hypothetical protein